MSTTIAIENTVSNIMGICSLDINIIRGSHESSVYGWLTDNSYTYHFPIQEQYLKADIAKLLRYALASFNTKVEIEQTSLSPYYFSISYFNDAFFAPAGITRAIMCSLKRTGAVIDFHKRALSLTNPDYALITNLVCKGKAKDVPDGLKSLQEECGKFHGTFNPWSREGELLQLSENRQEETMRFNGAEWFAAAMNNVSVVGCGGIGSHLANSLCRVLGDKTMFFYDSDLVEQKNLAGQDFSLHDIGRFKVSVLGEKCQSLNPLVGTEMYQVNYNLDSTPTRIMFTGLDNMAARNTVFTKWKGLVDAYEDSKNVCLLIDGRLSAEQWQIFCIQGDNEAAIKEYENNWLFSDDEAQGDVCTYKQTAFCAQMIAAYMVNLYINWCSNNIKAADDPTRRYLPFLTEYDAKQMILRTKEVV